VKTFVLMTATWLVGVSVVGTPGAASADQARGTAGRLAFNIPAQTLTTALDSYSEVTGREVFYDGALTLSRRSNAVQGSLAPDVALSDLLAGTGLVARPTGPASFTIEPSGRNSLPFVASSRSAAAPETYFADVQASVAHALCASDATRLGQADIIVRMWIGSSGKVVRTQAVEAVNRTNMSALEDALRGLSVGVPPSDVPQPIVLAVLARRPDQPNGCDDGR
jgi:hypothetical protein